MGMEELSFQCGGRIKNYLSNQVTPSACPPHRPLLYNRATILVQLTARYPT